MPEYEDRSRTPTGLRRQAGCIPRSTPPPSRVRTLRRLAQTAPPAPTRTNSILRHASISPPKPTWPSEEAVEFPRLLFSLLSCLPMQGPRSKIRRYRCQGNRHSATLSSCRSRTPCSSRMSLQFPSPSERQFAPSFSPIRTRPPTGQRKFCVRDRTFPDERRWRLPERDRSCSAAIVRVDIAVPPPHSEARRMSGEFRSRFSLW